MASILKGFLLDPNTKSDILKPVIPNSTISASQAVKKGFIYSLMPSLVLGGIMTLIKLMEVVGDFSLARYGLQPRVPSRLYGIVTFPFLHADWLHLFSNLLPFVFLSTLIVNLFPRIFLKIYLFTFFLSGFWTWCFAREGTVIGASGWVYALLGFLLVAGFSKSSRKTMIIAGGLAFLYGGMVEGLVPARPHISWEGHLMGLLSGVVAAIYWRKEIRETDNALVQPQTTQSSNATDTEEPSYPYWLYNDAPVVDMRRRIIHPDDLIWENGVPKLKPKEIETENEPTNPDELKNPPGYTHTAHPLTGYWNFTQT